VNTFSSPGASTGVRSVALTDDPVERPVRHLLHGLVGAKKA
jgi:hypothetical protein